MAKGAFRQRNTSSKPPLGFKLCSTTRSEPIETKTSIQCLDGKSSGWIVNGLRRIGLMTGWHVR